MVENGFGKRVDDSMGALGQITRKNPFVALILASLGSFVTSMLTVFTLITDPIKSEMYRMEGNIQLNGARVHEITKRIGSAPRAAPDVAKLYQRTDDLRRDMTAAEAKIENIQIRVSKLEGLVSGLQRDYDKLYRRIQN